MKKAKNIKQYKSVIVRYIDNIRYSSLNLYYNMGIVILSILVVVITISFFHISSFWKCAISVISIPTLVYFLWIIKPSLFESLLSDEYKKKNGIELSYRWNSRDFEEFVGKDILELYEDTRKLLGYFTNQESKSSTRFYDYSFIVFPFAKAYEGILKKILVEANFISEANLLEDPSLSINKYFNPVGNNKIFTSLKDKTRDKAVPFVIYSTYQECRNQIIHYDSYRDNRIKTLQEAEFYINRIFDAIEKAYKTFKKS